MFLCIFINNFQLEAASVELPPLLCLLRISADFCKMNKDSTGLRLFRRRAKRCVFRFLSRVVELKEETNFSL